MDLPIFSTLVDTLLFLFTSPAIVCFTEIIFQISRKISKCMTQLGKRSF